MEILEDVSAISNRVLGPDHPGTQKIQKHLDAAREKLTRAAEAPVATRSKAEES